MKYFMTPTKSLQCLLLYTSCTIPKFSILNTYIGMSYLTMFDPLSGGYFGYRFRSGEGKFTTSTVSQEVQMA